MLNIDDSLGYIISTVARKVNQYFSVSFQSFDITSEQWAVLNKLAEQDGISQRQLSERTEKDPNNITKILDQLEKKGWIKRAANPQDRRSFLINITENGRLLIKQVAPLEERLMSSLYASLSVDEIALLRKILFKLNMNINRKM
ncbi:DNA-binding MarR family transcriptional regulator [Sporomusaceae bacterium BoRhaA]|uniref:MarR family winged helix-turn-helix transcriptional regulator n=1 Tax=Pelorhabdus rhamnosifermentans TaxID=2772457 RepID=UPI001C062346|nr:MarR family transcriptional regulator [Pelorhabdus rhamnosifermentans]MBU2699986.1 DNA-binding MarR family transcriptional regulator [Pelorhabdus rhamnosifermentans]